MGAYRADAVAAVGRRARGRRDKVALRGCAREEGAQTETCAGACARLIANRLPGFHTRPRASAAAIAVCAECKRAIVRGIPRFSDLHCSPGCARTRDMRAVTFHRASGLLPAGMPAPFAGSKLEDSHALHSR